MNREGLMRDGRARITWGESRSSTRAFLISNGMSEDDAEAKIEEWVLERNAEIRRLGIRSTLIGCLFVGVSGILLCFLLGEPGVTIGVGRACAFLILAALYGVWKLVNGIYWLVRPKSEERSIPDISG
jgi:hypothetical protein